MGRPSDARERLIKAARDVIYANSYEAATVDETIQQCRALTLIHALFVAGELRPASRLGIVGGGAAGVTAAAAAARRGAKVIRFERA